VRKFVEEFHATGKKLHVVVNNAGVALNFKDVKRQYTTDGFELTIGTNHLGLLSSVLRVSFVSNAVTTIQGGPKMAPFLYALSFRNIDQFSKLFHSQNHEKICIILSLKIPPHLKCVAVRCTLTGVTASKYDVTRQFGIFKTPKKLCYIAKEYGRKRWERSPKQIVYCPQVPSDAAVSQCSLLIESAFSSKEVKHNFHSNIQVLIAVSMFRTFVPHPL